MMLRRRRIYWQPWNWSTRMWLVAIAASVLMSPIATRWFFLWQVPDVKLPFNVEDVIRDDVPPDDDALVQYSAIAKRLSASWPDGRYGYLCGRDLEWEPSDRFS